MVLDSPLKKTLFTQAIRTAVAAILRIDLSAVSVFSTFPSARRRLMEVGDGRNLHGAEAGINTVYLVTKAGTTITELATVISGSTDTIVSGLAAVGISGTTVRAATVTAGSPPGSAKSSASSGTSSHVAIMIYALAAVMIPTTLL